MSFSTKVQDCYSEVNATSFDEAKKKVRVKTSANEDCTIQEVADLLKETSLTDRPNSSPTLTCAEAAHQVQNEDRFLLHVQKEQHLYRPPPVVAFAKRGQPQGGAAATTSSDTDGIHVVYESSNPNNVSRSRDRRSWLGCCNTREGSSRSHSEERPIYIPRTFRAATRRGRVRTYSYGSGYAGSKASTLYGREGQRDERKRSWTWLHHR